jgi:hypothetical protein
VGGYENACKNLIEKPEGKRPLWRSRVEWEDNIKIDLKAIWCECVDWVHLYHDGVQVQWWALVCQSRFGVRIPNRQTFEIDRKLDILFTAPVYIMIEGGVIKAFIVAPCFIKR